MKEKNAVYAGSFDPIHLGHLWVIEQGSKLFDKLFVVIGNNNTKKHLFTKEERKDFISEVLDGIDNIQTSILTDDELTSDFAQSRQCSYMLRGLRGSQDLTYESTIQYVNSQLHPTIQTVYLNTPIEFQYISSSVVRELLKFKKYDLLKEKYLPNSVSDKIIKHWIKFKNV